MRGLRAWWRARRAQRHACGLDDADVARICGLTMQACKLWAMPVVTLNADGVRVTSHMEDGAASEVLRYDGPNALDDLEAELARRIRGIGQA